MTDASAARNFQTRETQVIKLSTYQVKVEGKLASFTGLVLVQAPGPDVAKAIVEERLKDETDPLRDVEFEGQAIYCDVTGVEEVVLGPIEVT